MMKKSILLLLFLLSSSVSAEQNGLDLYSDQEENPKAAATILPDIAEDSSPDFVVTGITLIPASPKNGSTFKAKVTVKNKGMTGGDAGLLKVWADKPTSRNCQADGGKSTPVGMLNPGARKTLTVTGLFAGADGGQKTLRAFVDSDCATPEANDNNNQSLKAYGRSEDADAEWIALELSGALLPPRALYLQLRNDLKAIRQAYPVVEGVHQNPYWQLGMVSAKITSKQITQINASELGPVTVFPSFSEWHAVLFALRYNPTALIPLLKSRFGVVDIEPSGFAGSGDFIGADPSNHIYTFSQGSGDCMSGCIYRHNWEFSVSSAGLVTLLREYDI